jgi:hypothetical protein
VAATHSASAETSVARESAAMASAKAGVTGKTTTAAYTASAVPCTSLRPQRQGEQ